MYIYIYNAKSADDGDNSIVPTIIYCPHQFYAIQNP